MTAQSLTISLNIICKKEGKFIIQCICMNMTLRNRMFDEPARLSFLNFKTQNLIFIAVYFRQETRDVC